MNMKMNINGFIQKQPLSLKKLDSNKEKDNKANTDTEKQQPKQQAKDLVQEQLFEANGAMMLSSMNKAIVEGNINRVIAGARKTAATRVNRAPVASTNNNTANDVTWKTSGITTELDPEDCLNFNFFSYALVGIDKKGIPTVRDREGKLSDSIAPGESKGEKLFSAIYEYVMKIYKNDPRINDRVVIAVWQDTMEFCQKHQWKSYCDDPENGCEYNKENNSWTLYDKDDKEKLHGTEISFSTGDGNITFEEIFKIFNIKLQYVTNDEDKLAQYGNLDIQKYLEASSITHKIETNDIYDSSKFYDEDEEVFKLENYNNSFKELLIDYFKPLLGTKYSENVLVNIYNKAVEKYTGKENNSDYYDKIFSFCKKEMIKAVKDEDVYNEYNVEPAQEEVQDVEQTSESIVDASMKTGLAQIFTTEGDVDKVTQLLEIYSNKLEMVDMSKDKIKQLFNEVIELVNNGKWSLGVTHKFYDELEARIYNLHNGVITTLYTKDEIQTMCATVWDGLDDDEFEMLVEAGVLDKNESLGQYCINLNTLDEFGNWSNDGIDKPNGIVSAVSIITAGTYWEQTDDKEEMINNKWLIGPINEEYIPNMRNEQVARCIGLTDNFVDSIAMDESGKYCFQHLSFVFRNQEFFSADQNEISEDDYLYSLEVLNGFYWGDANYMYEMYSNLDGYEIKFEYTNSDKNGIILTLTRPDGKEGKEAKLSIELPNDKENKEIIQKIAEDIKEAFGIDVQ